MVSSPKKKTRRGDSSARIYEGIRSSILAMKLPPGASIDEAALVKRFQVSRTPVREALVRLASEGLVTLLPNRGSQVSPLDLARIRDYLEAVDLVQRAVTALAARRRSEAALKVIEATDKGFEEAAARSDPEAMIELNRDFHLAIGQACGNVLLIPTYTRLLDEGLRIARFTLNEFFYQSAEGYHSFVERVVREHREMVRAIRERDPAAAEAVAKAHTDHTRARFSEFLFEGFSTPGSVL